MFLYLKPAADAHVNVACHLAGLIRALLQGAFKSASDRAPVELAGREADPEVEEAGELAAQAPAEELPAHESATFWPCLGRAPCFS